MTGKHRMAPPRPDGSKASLAIAAISAAPVSLIVALALGCRLGYGTVGLLAVTMLFTCLLTVYALIVMALVRECRKRIGGGGRRE